MQYTLRNVPPQVDRALRARALKLGKSVNFVALEALSQSVGQPAKYRNLRGMLGAWSKREAAKFDRFLEGERVIDDELWK